MALANTSYLIPINATGNGTTDDTAAIQQALDAALAQGGGTVFLPSGTYLISNSLVMGTNVSLLGEGASSLLLTVSDAVFPEYMDPTGNVTRCVIRNVNHDATSLTDNNIMIEKIAIKFYNHIFNGHAINIRFCSELTVRDVVTWQMSDCVAALACKDVLIDGCKAYYATNCAFDFWNSPGRTVVRDCYALAAQNAVNWDGISTTGSQGSAQGLLVDGCFFEKWTNAAIVIDPLSSVSSAMQFDILNTRFQGDPSTTHAGIVVHGGQIGTISNNIFLNVNGGIIYCTADSNGVPTSHLNVNDNTFYGCNAASSNSSYITISGQYCRVQGNRAILSTAITGAALDDITNVLLDNDFTGAVTYATGAALQLTFDSVNGLIGIGAPLHLPYLKQAVNDAAAATASVPLNCAYLNGSQLMVRQV